MSDQTIRILLVEDDDTDREAVERLVRKEQPHYDLQTAVSMAEALEQLRDGAYDIVLLDYELGDGTGLEVLPHVGDTPTIFITGGGSEQIAVEAMRKGAYDYLIKDLDRNYLRVLSSTIKNVLERKRLEEVSKKVDALETSNVVIGNFVGDALGNLISPIYGRTQMIIKIRDNVDEIKKDLKDIEKGLAKFLTGINAFREYFRFGERPMKERSSTDISHILSSLLSGQTLETYGKDKFPIDPNVKLRFTYDPKQEEALDLNQLPYVVGTESEVTTAIQETLINAIESYDPEKGGDMVISAKKEKDNLILEIADQGRGMSPDEAKQSQLPFYKILGVKGSTRFGLGAYIACESAKHCEGGIDIESTEGVGTTASVLFKISNNSLVDM